MRYRPGPAVIARGGAPDGWVLRVYGCTDPGPYRLAYVSLIVPAPHDVLVRAAIADADAVDRLVLPGERVVMVFYDGDTGARTAPFGAALVKDVVPEW